jgi:hypothetical protein
VAVDSSLAGRAAAGQLIAVLVLFALLLVLPLSDSFFTSYGLVIGPLSWLVCSFVVGRVLSLSVARTLAAAAAGGAVAALAALALTHAIGLLAGIVAFGLATGAWAERPPAEAPAERAA